MKYKVSITTIPPRINKDLYNLLEQYEQYNIPVILSIPKEYKKWGKFDIPKELFQYKNIKIHRPLKDYGPSTKLLGALEAITDEDLVITFDDDMVYENPKEIIDYYIEEYNKHKCIITAGGIKLDHYPYRCGDGLNYSTYNNYVNLVAGYRGVLYPVKLIQKESIYALDSKLPEGIFNDDDIYFGIMAKHCNIPIYSIPPKGGLKDTNNSAIPGVTFQTNIHRIDNEMNIIQYALKNNLL